MFPAATLQPHTIVVDVESIQKVVLVTPLEDRSKLEKTSQDGSTTASQDLFGVLEHLTRECPVSVKGKAKGSSCCHDESVTSGVELLEPRERCTQLADRFRGANVVLASGDTVIVGISKQDIRKCDVG